MKKFSVSVSVERSTGVDTVVSASGDFNQSEVREAFGVAQAAIESEDEEGATYSGTANVWDDELGTASTETITVGNFSKATFLEFSAFMATPAGTSIPVGDGVSNDAPESDEQQQ